MRKMILVFTFIAMTMMSANAFASPTVTYTVSGSANNWILDFSVTNNLGGDMKIYNFGIQLSVNNIVETPTGWGAWGADSTWSNSSLGGSNTVYNNIWSQPFVDPSYSVNNGQTLSGFKVLITDELAPTMSIKWFALAANNRDGDGTPYAGSDYFNTAQNPGFEGVAYATNSSPVPIPGAVWLLGSGLAGIVGLKKKYLG